MPEDITLYFNDQEIKDFRGSVDGNDFVSEYVSGLRNKNMSHFEEKFYNADVLLVDDIQYIANKPGIMDEFFNTFNKLYKKKKQIVITSDLPPKEFDLNERLISRFRSTRN